MKAFSIFKNTLFLCIIILTVTGCDMILDELGDGVRALGALCIIAFGLLIAYIVYNAFLRNEPEGRDTLIGTILALGVVGGAFVLAYLLPSDAIFSIGIIALIIGVIILIIYLRNKKE